MRRGAAAVFLSPLFMLVGAGVAHADARFTLIDAQAVAGATVHFSISGTEGRASYGVEVGDHEVAAGSIGSGATVSGAFTMPHLGSASRTVTVEAQIEESEDTTTVTRSLQYVVPAPAPAVTTTPSPSVAPAAAPQPTANPGPEHGSKTSPGPAQRRPAKKRSSRRPAKARTKTRPGTRRHNAAGPDASTPHRRSPARLERAKRPAPRTAPLFDGVPEGSGSAPAHQPPSGGASGVLGLNALAPPTAALAAPPAPGDGGPPTAAVVVPALLALAGMLLATVAVVRRRRFAAATTGEADARLAALRKVARSGAGLRRGTSRRGRPPRVGD